MDLALSDVDGDVVIDNGDLLRVENADAIEQNISQRLKIYLGEFFLDQTVGIPYFQSILVKKANLAVVDAVLKDTIINTLGVLELIEFELDYDAQLRSLLLSFQARVLDGVVDFKSITLNTISGGA